MQLHNLMKIKDRSKKIVGRGTSSGKGKTSARGQKGQKARGSVKLGFVGGTLPLYKRLPFRRGLGNVKMSGKYMALDIAKLSVFAKNAEVNLESLIEAKLVSVRVAKLAGVKLVGNATLNNPLTVKLPASKSAATQIEKAGGKLI